MADLKYTVDTSDIDKLNTKLDLLKQKLERAQNVKGGNVSNFKWFKDLKQEVATTQTALTKLSAQRNPLEFLKGVGQGIALGFKDATGQTLSLSNAMTNLSSSLGNVVIAYASVQGAQQLFNISLESARFDVLRENFRGTTEDLELFRKATAGTVNDANLIKLSNQASDLGIGLKEQAILFSLAEDAADKYGTGVEEGFQKVVMASEGNVKGLKSLGIQKEVYEAIVKELAKAHGDEIDKLDAETQKQIRLEAIIKASGQTYDSVTQKVKDNADKHESLLVTIQNLGLTWGGEFVASLTGVLTAYRAIETVINAISKVMEIQKNIIMASVTAWESLTAKIPIVGDAISWLADRYRDLAGAQSMTADMVDSPDAGEDFVKAFDPNSTPDKTRSGSNANFKKGGVKTGKTGVDTQKVLNFLEQFRENVKKIEAEIASLNSQLSDSNLLEFEKLAIQDELIKKQKELNELKRVNLGLTAQEITGSILGTPSLQFGSARLTPMGQSIFSQGEQDTNEAIQREINELLDNIQNAFSGVLDFSQSILNHFGMADSVMADIVNKLSSLFGIAQKGISVIETIAGIFSGGGGVAGMSYSGGGGVLVANISLKSELERDKMVRAVVRVTPEVNYMLNQKNVN